MEVLPLLILFLPWKVIFLYIIFLGTIIALSASSWIIAWIGLEINILGLLALLIRFKSPRNSEATLKYFLIQALASAILICRAFRGSILFGSLSSLDLFSNFILRSLLIKLGAAPFHLWVPQVVEGFNWLRSALILRWQKIAPFALVLFCFEKPNTLTFKLLTISILLSAALGAIGGLSQSSSRKIVAFSSVNHIGWILVALISSLSLWGSYFVFYSLILFTLISLLRRYNISSLSQNLISIDSLPQTSVFITLLSFGGLPPFRGFIPKWMVVREIVDSPVVLTVLVVSRLFTLFFYLRLGITSLLQKSPSTFSSFYKTSGRLTVLYSFLLNFLGIFIIPTLFII
jgi:NADH-ubiquinone oxidoreductase chain 2